MKSWKYVLGLVLTCSIGLLHAQKKRAEVWLTHPDRSALFSPQPEPVLFRKKGAAQGITIGVDEQQQYQTMDGFGFTLTGGSAQHLMRMTPVKRAAILQELFGQEGKQIGTSYLRLSIGASDLNERVFSYNDLPAGETDTLMTRFDLGPDRLDVIPVLKEILAINPEIKLMGSPWSPPAWMKSNKDTRGGSLLPQYYPAYARYFVKYIQAMQAEGITIDAITVQNEPLHPGNNPSLLMQAAEQAAFVKNHLGPAFRAAGIRTKIIIYDHNADRPDYPISILNDPEAKQYIDGSAFHLYGGTIDALNTVHQAHPDRNLYFTEQWIGAPGNLKKNLKEHITNLIVGAPRNWSRTVLEWNLANGPDHKPYTDRGGCTTCLGAITLSGDSVTRNPAYYIIAHAAKFVRPGSVRIASNYSDTLPNVAFRNPQGRKVLIVYNNTESDQAFTIRFKKRTANYALKAGSVGTFVWK